MGFEDRALTLGGRAAMVAFGAYLAWPAGVEDVATGGATSVPGFAAGVALVLGGLLLPEDDLRKLAQRGVQILPFT